MSEANDKGEGTTSPSRRLIALGAQLQRGIVSDQLLQLFHSDLPAFVKQFQEEGWLEAEPGDIESEEATQALGVAHAIQDFFRKFGKDARQACPHVLALLKLFGVELGDAEAGFLKELIEGLALVAEDADEEIVGPLLDFIEHLCLFQGYPNDVVPAACVEALAHFGGVAVMRATVERLGNSHRSFFIKSDDPDQTDPFQYGVDILCKVAVKIREPALAVFVETLNDGPIYLAQAACERLQQLGAARALRHCLRELEEVDVRQGVPQGEARAALRKLVIDARPALESLFSLPTSTLATDQFDLRDLKASVAAADLLTWLNEDYYQPRVLSTMQGAVDRLIHFAVQRDDNGELLQYVEDMSWHLGSKAGPVSDSLLCLLEKGNEYTKGVVRDILKRIDPKRAATTDLG